MNFLKENRITLLRELLVTQMNHWMFFPLYVILFDIIGDVAAIDISRRAPLVLLWLAFSIIPFLLYLGRSRMKKFWQIILLHGAVISIMVLIPTEHIVITAIHTLFGVTYVILSGYLWSTKQNREDIKMTPSAGVGISVVMLMILKNQIHTEWDSIFVMILIITICMYFIIYYIEQYQNFLTVNSSSAGHIPAKAMFQSGMGLILGYTGIGLLLMILVANVDWLKYVFHLLKALLAAFLQWFFSLFPRGGEDTSTYTDQTQNMAEDMMPMEELGESFWLWNVLESVLVMAIFAVVIFFAIKGVLFLIRFIRSKLQGIDFKQPNHDAKEDSYDVREKCEIVRDNSWTMKLPFLSSDPKERIRHLYKKRLVASKSAFKEVNGEQNLLNRFTARECGQILAREQLAAVYEKARYSNEDCNSEDIKRMKEACK